MFRAISGCVLPIFFAGTMFAAELDLNFTSQDLNKTPAGFRGTVNGSASPGEWKVVMAEVPSAFPAVSPKSPIVNKQPVLAQLSRDRTDERYVTLVYDKESFGDFTLSTQLKIVGGEAEQMAGVAFRIQDEKNYYYIRANAVDNNIYFFKWVEGKLYGPIGSKIEVAKGVWHDFVVECHGNEIRCKFNGKEAFPALQDNNFSSGKMGFWTKSDAIAYFGDTRIVYRPREPFAQSLVRDMLEKYPRLLGLTIFAAPTNSHTVQAIASKEPSEIGAAAEKAERDVIERASIYHAKGKGRISVIMPMRDSNGDTVAAVRVVMKSLPGQTEKNAVARALPIVRQMQSRLQRGAELFQ